MAANPRAVAEYATAAVLSMGTAGTGSPTLDALFDSMTPAVATTSSSGVVSKMAADLRHLCSGAGADSPVQAADTWQQDSGQRLVGLVRQLAAAAVLTRQRAFVGTMESALQSLKRMAPAGGRPAAEGLLSLGEQGALVQHILLCPAAGERTLPGAEDLEKGAVDSLLQECSPGRLLSALQPLCVEYCSACAGAAEGESGMVHARLLPLWLPQQVPGFFLNFLEYHSSGLRSEQEHFVSAVLIVKRALVVIVQRAFLNGLGENSWCCAGAGKLPG